MSQAPTPYTRQKNFVSDATNNPSITVPQISTGLDAEFVAVQDSLNTAINRLGEIQRDDGALRDAIVSAQSLSPSLLSLLGLKGVVLRGAWAAPVAYAQGDVVGKDGGTYFCAIAHTSDSIGANGNNGFELALLNGKWLTLEAPYNNSTSVQRFIANGSQKLFALGVTGTINTTNVFIDGVYQNKNTYSVTTGAESFDGVLFPTPPPSGSTIEVVVGASVSVAVLIPENSIGTDKIIDGSITTPKLASGAVTGEKLASGAVSQNLGFTPVDTSDSRLSDQRVPQDNSVTSAKIVNNSVTLAKIATDAKALMSKAWVIFNGTTSPATIRSSYNVSSVTKNGTGDYTVNFATAMTDANYACFGTGHGISVNAPRIITIQSNIDGTAPNKTTTSVRVFSTQGTTASDSVNLSFGVFGN